MSARAPRVLLAAFAGIALVVATGSAAAQEDEPALNESDFDTSTPEHDDSWLEDEGGNTSTSGDGGTDSGSTTTNETGDEPTLAESDLDVTPPEFDESWLADDAAAEPETAEESEDPSRTDGTADAGSADDAAARKAAERSKPVPGAGAFAAVGALAGLAVATRRSDRH